jgi:phage terminase large subunit-like protein
LPKSRVPNSERIIKDPIDPGERAIRFISNLTLCDEFRGQPFVLREWQKEEILRPLFGTLKPDGRRQYRECLLMLPRKQAKTQLSSGIGDYLLLGTGKSGQETVCAASDRAQASHLYRKCRDMIEADSYLRKLVKVYESAKVIEATRTGNTLKVVSSDGRRQHGLNPSGLLFDELHTQPNSELYDVLTSAQAARHEPLNIYISTAGNNRDSLCYRVLERARKIKADPSIDPNFLPILYGAEDGDDWTKEATWRKAMPALGDFASLEFIQAEFRKALDSASEESKFKQLYLNLWVGSVAKWLDREGWDLCGSKPNRFDYASLRGRPCYAGIDLSEKCDISALVLLFPWEGGTYRVLCRFWLPEDVANERAAKGDKRYVQWASKGFLTLTPGHTIEHEYIWSEVLALAELYDFRMIRLDPYRATQTAAHLVGAGLPVELMRQGFISMTEPTTWLEIMIRKGLMHHNRNPVLNWMADNAVSEKDPGGNVKISKARSADKVDGMVCLVMALAAAMADGNRVESDVFFLGR